jgi:hypothetical protein
MKQEFEVFECARHGSAGKASDYFPKMRGCGWEILRACIVKSENVDTFNFETACSNAGGELDIKNSNNSDEYIEGMMLKKRVYSRLMRRLVARPLAKLK